EAVSSRSPPDRKLRHNRAPSPHEKPRQTGCRGRSCQGAHTFTLVADRSAAAIIGGSQREGRFDQPLSRFETSHTLAQLGGLLGTKVHLRTALEIVRRELATNPVFQTSDAKEAALAVALATSPHAVLDHKPVTVPATAQRCAQSCWTHC